MQSKRTPMHAARVCLFLALAFLCTALIFAPAAVRAESALTSTAAATPSLSPDPGLNGLTLDGFSAEKLTGWMADEGIADLFSDSEDGHKILRADTTESENGIYAILRLFGTERKNLIEHSHISASLKIDGDADASYTVSLTLYSALSTVTAETQIRGDEWFAISADISEWHLRTGVDLVEIRVLDTEGAGVDSILVGSLKATGKASLDIADTFLTFGFTADGGTAQYENGAYLLDAEADGIMTLVADAARSDYGTSEGITALKIVLADAVPGGTLSLAVSDAFSGLSSFDISSSCQLYGGTNTYLLPFDDTVSLHAYRLSFRSLFPAGNADSVRLLSVSLIHLPIADTSVYAGKITNCSFSEGLSALSVAGTLPSGTVADNMGGTLALYEIPVWSDLETVLQNDAPVDSMKISTRFTFTVDLRGREASAAVSRYAAVLLTENGAVPVAAARFPDLPKGESRSSRSAVGLSGADAAGVFAANAANVIVDVYVDELLGGVTGNNSGRLCIRGGRYYYLDTQYLRALGEEIAFYEAADVDVYLRLLSETDLSARNFTFSYDGAGFFAFDVTNEDGAYMLSAVTDYLAAAYPSLRGFIVGERLDSAVYNGADLSDIDAYAALCADTMRIVYTAAAAHIPDISIIAPIGHYLAEAEAASTSADGVFADTVLLSVYLSRHAAASGNMPLGLLYVSDNSAEMIGHMENLLGRMSAVHAAVPTELYLLWQPAPTSAADLLLMEYSERCESIARLGARAFFLGVDRQTNTDELYQNLKYVEIAGDTGRRLHEDAAVLLTGENPPAESGVYTLYDFSKSFSTMHWIAGSGCETLTTQAGIIEEGARSMHAVFPSDDGSMFGKANGSILCMMPAALDFTPAPIITCTLLAASSLESTDTVEIIFVFGSDDARAEYAITVPAGQPVTVLCDLTAYEWASSINSAAVLVQANSPVTLDIASIRCHSTAYTSADLREHFASSLSGGAGAAGTADTISFAEAAVLISLLVATLSVFALLSRKENGKPKGGAS